LFEDPDFLQLYIDRWSELRTNVLATSNVLARVDAMVAQLDGAIERNYQRWPTLGKPVHPNKFVGQTCAEEVNWLKQWITGRLAWIDSQGFPAPMSHVIREPDQPASKVSLAWLAGRLFYATNGNDPRLSGGGVSPSAREYSEPVQLSAGAQLRARRVARPAWPAPASRNEREH
jgi:hypothetical protein